MTEPKNLWETAWKLLHRGQADPKHAYRSPVVGTLSPTLHPRTRTLILRKAQPSTGELWCYTDRRSGKAADLAVHPRMSWTFWDPRQRIQFSGSGLTRWLPLRETDERFRQLPKHSRKAYATLAAPGTPLAEAGDGLPADWSQLSEAETDFARDNFGILVTWLDRVEILRLAKTGQRRLLATREAEAEWQLGWVVP
ncbi:MAG: hypothetical protein AAFN92_21985 [Bacteroidota bacterium]